MMPITRRSALKTVLTKVSTFAENSQHFFLVLAALIKAAKVRINVPIKVLEICRHLWLMHILFALKTKIAILKERRIQ